VLFAAVNDIGRAWKASKCLAALATPGKTPTALLEYCATGMKQSDALSLVKLVQGTMKLTTDGAPLGVEDAEASPKLGALQAVVKSAGIRSLLALPIMEGDQQLGVVVLEQCDRRRRWRPAEITVLKSIVDQMAMATSTVKLRSLVKNLAVTDERSGMLTRASYLDCLLAETARAQKQGSTLCVALMQFGKADLVGEAGEEGMRRLMDDVGHSMTAHLRQNDLAIKYDSSTVALVLPDTKGPEAMQVMDKIRRLMSSIKLAGKPSPPVTFGLAEPILDSGIDAVDSVTELINRAEDALEAACKEGLGTGKLLTVEF
jgi:PleD family two-component response regulator